MLLSLRRKLVRAMMIHNTVALIPFPSIPQWLLLIFRSTLMDGPVTSDRREPDSADATMSQPLTREYHSLPGVHLDEQQELFMGKGQHDINDNCSQCASLPDDLHQLYYRRRDSGLTSIMDEAAKTLQAILVPDIEQLMVWEGPSWTGRRCTSSSSSSLPLSSASLFDPVPLQRVFPRDQQHGVDRSFQ